MKVKNKNKKNKLKGIKKLNWMVKLKKKTLIKGKKNQKNKD
jgi:hypothetical protein